ncbi:MBL fold metallo-hydrolase [Sphingomonas sp. NFX23]|uniref:MBL fold metallo-hydrolase n=1 Tax=Sphingomonas sp. NFX23 TaxID=2819532 RepID=UPI003CF9301B
MLKQVGLRLVDTGSCRHPEFMTIRGGALKPAVFPSLVGVIRHPDEGLVLFDTGYDPAFLKATEHLPERLYRLLTPPTIATPVADVLIDAGIDPDSIAHIVLSHFHGDHSSGLKRFPNAIVHCAKAGLQRVWGRGRVAALRAGTPVGVLPDDLPARSAFFEDMPLVSLPRDLLPFDLGADVLGDGALLAVPLPGHCPGHWGLVLREAGGLRFLVADAAWSSRAIRENRPPPTLTATLLGDANEVRSTLGRLHALTTRNPEIVLTPSHCAESAARLNACDGY